MNSLNASFLSRVKSAVLRRSLFANLAEWITEHTFREGHKFSFKDHEYQIQIANEIRSLVCKKPSQVGMSELQLRKALAFTAVSRDKNLIYVLPSGKFGMKFCKGRIDPVIASSPTLRQLRNTGVNSTELKQIGSSFLYISGASNSSQAISVPAEAVMFDEVNFCNQQVLGDYESRLGHAENGGNSSKFSTPTLADFGISKELKLSTWARYCVKCPKCYDEVAPVFSQHVRIPGFDRPFAEFNRDVLESGKYKIDLAFIACPRCGARLDESFGDPTRRRWIEQFPGREIAGYEIKPFDLIKYNPTNRVLRRFTKYKRLSSYFNFALGEDFSDTDVEIFPSIVEDNRVVAQNSRPFNRPVQMGVDVGNICHCMIGEEINGQKVVYEVWKIYASDGDLKIQIMKAAQDRNVDLIVIDAQPEKNMARGIRAEYMHGDAWPAYYVETGERDPQYWAIKEDKDHMVINRTTACNDFVTDVNKSLWKWPMSEEMDIAKFHFTQMKKLQEASEEDSSESLENIKARWVKVTNSDHYFHAGVLLQTAIQVVNNDVTGHVSVAPLSFHSVAMKEPERTNVVSALMSRVRR